MNNLIEYISRMKVNGSNEINYCKELVSSYDSYCSSLQDQVSIGSCCYNKSNTKITTYDKSSGSSESKKFSCCYASCKIPVIYEYFCNIKTGSTPTSSFNLNVDLKYISNNILNFIEAKDITYFFKKNYKSPLLSNCAVSAEEGTILQDIVRLSHFRSMLPNGKFYLFLYSKKDHSTKLNKFLIDFFKNPVDVCTFTDERKEDNEIIVPCTTRTLHSTTTESITTTDSIDIWSMNNNYIFTKCNILNTTSSFSGKTVDGYFFWIILLQ